MRCARGEVDFSIRPSRSQFSSRRSTPAYRLTVLAGVHVGCFELFAREGIRSIADLKGKSVGLKAEPRRHLLDADGGAGRARPGKGHPTGSPTRRSSRWSFSPTARSTRSSGSRRSRRNCAPARSAMSSSTPRWTVLGRSISAACCRATADYVRKYPVATKRVLRAILKATDLCATEPARRRAAIVDRGFTPRYDYALQTLSEDSLRQVAGLRCRGHDALLRAAAARSRA